MFTTRSRIFSKQEIFEIADLYQSGMTAIQISSKLSIKVWKIHQAIRLCREMTGDYPSHRYSHNKRLASIDEIKRVVCDVYKITHNDLLGERKTRKVIEPRHIAAHLAYKLSGLSLNAVGKRFDGRDHTTILWSFRVAPERYPDKIAKIEKMILDKERIAA